MNDRYLFKAKRIDWRELPEKEWWVVGYYLFYDNTHIIIVSDKSHIEYIEIDPTTICQCTGLKDKNGTMIWENDLVLTPKEGGYSLICWTDTEARWEMHNEIEGIVLDFDNYWSNEIEVCGNKFDNPELLEVEWWLKV